MFENEEEITAPSRSWLKIFLIMIVILILLCIGFGVGAVLYVAKALQPVEPQTENIHVVIEPGMNSTQISNLLEQKGLIRNATVFRYYLNYKGKGHRLQAGEYQMKPGQELDDMIQKMESGDVIQTEMFTLTIPEGFTAEQIAARMARMEHWDESEVLKLMNEKNPLFGDIIKHIPDDPNMKYLLEGYMFPETYHIEQDATAPEAMQKLLNMTAQKLEALPEGWEKQLDDLGITFHEMMTIASLIEREVVVDEERPIVAGVIYNRIETGMKLQIDATVQYALGEQQEVIYLSDLEIDSPYNTYKIEGLPPGPIASPGLNSIEAALYPEKTDYYYYVTKKDGSSEHWFAKTYEEHLKNKNRSEN